jgi:HlyD family secretion protein
MGSERDVEVPAPPSFDDTLDVLRIDPRRKRRRRVPRVVLAAVVVAAVGGGIAASRFWASPVTVAVARAVRVDPGAPTTVLTASGYVVPDRKIELSPRITGRVEWVGINRNDRVTKGQVLIRLEQRDILAQVAQARATVQLAQARLRQLLAGSRQEEIQQARALVDEATSNVEFTETNLKRIEKLYADGLVARQVLDESRNQRDTARAKLKAAQERLHLVKAGPRLEEIDQARAELGQAEAGVELAEANLENTLIRAPIDGTILERLVEPGETVATTIVSQRGAKSAMVSMADLRHLHVEVDVNQSDLRKLRLGMPATAVADALPDRAYEGVLVEMAPEANRQKATLQVKVRVLKPDRRIRPEMNARVVFQDPPKQPGERPRVVVPRDAVVARGDTRVVVVVVDGKAVERRVALGAEADGQVEVLEGLEGGETVVISRTAALAEGQAVRTKQ